MSDPRTRQQVEILVVNCRGKWFTSPVLRTLLAAQGCEATIEEDTDLPAIIRTVNGKSAPQVLLVDLLTGPQDALEDNGLAVIQAARAYERTTAGEHKPAMIVALWQGNRADGLDGKALRSGADCVVEFASLTEVGGIEQLAKSIHTWLVEHQIIDFDPHLRLPVRPDAGLLTALSDVGELTVRLLIAKLSANVLLAEPAYVTPGASGAHVLRATLTTTAGERSWLLKLSRDKKSLQAELTTSQSLFGSYGGLIVRYLPNGPAEHNGWFMIATEFARAAETLRVWLTRPASAARVPDLLDALFFDDGLVSNFGPPEELARSADDLFTFPDFRRARFGRAVDELHDLLGDPRGAALDDVETIVSTIRAFVRDGQIGGIGRNRRPGSAIGVVQHGDLHGGNILVTGGDRARPNLIDLASHGVHHWAYDLARLVVDIVMHCVDLSPDWHFWERWASWRQTLTRVSEFGVVPDDPGNPGATAAMRWVVEHHRRLLPHLDEKNSWQWNIAIAEQLLRAACRGLPTPKRVLGLAGAYDQIRLAGQAIGTASEDD